MDQHNRDSGGYTDAEAQELFERGAGKLDRRARVWELALAAKGTSQAAVSREIALKVGASAATVKKDLQTGEREGRIVRTPGDAPVYTRGETDI